MSASQLLVGLLLASVATPSIAQRSAPLPAESVALRAAPWTGISFVENRGQWDSPACFVARSGALALGAEPNALVLLVRDEGPAQDDPLVVRLEFERARTDPCVAGLDPLPGVRHYYLGDDPERWRSGVRSYAGVQYSGLYPGIDLRLRDASGRLEYDLLLEPGADLDRVRVRCRGVEVLELAPDGTLLLHTARGPLRQSAPRTFSVTPGGERREVACRFELLGPDLFGFRADERDRELPLVIDPGLEWSTYVGGSDEDQALGAALDPNGRIVLAGRTYSTNFPVTNGSGPGGLEDAFVTVLDPDAATPQQQLVWSLYLGGSLRDRALGVDTDAAGNVYVTGMARSDDFPTTPGAYDETWNGTLDAFVAEFDPDGAMLYSTYLGGGDQEWGVNLQPQAPHVVTIGGTTLSSDLPVTPGCAQPAFGGLRDYFVARLDLSVAGTAGLLYSTYVGGGNWEGGANNIDNPHGMTYFDLAVDAAGGVFVTGRSYGNGFPTTSDAYQPVSISPGAYSVLVAHIRPNGAGSADWVYATYVGGSGHDVATAVAVDPSGVVVAGGYTYSDDFPTTPGAYQTALALQDDWFLFRLDPSVSPASSQLLYSTYVGGDMYDWVRSGSLRLTASGEILAAGSSGSQGVAFSTFPVTADAMQTTFGGWYDGVLIHLDPAGNGQEDLKYSTFLGGSLSDGLVLAGLFPGPCMRVAVGGLSRSSDFPTTPGAFQPTFGGDRDAVAARIDLGGPPPETYCTAGLSANGCQAVLSAGGTPSATAASGFDLMATSVEGAKDGLFFFGSSGRQANPWGNGTSLQCVVPPVKRGGLLTGVGTPGGCDGAFSQDLNALWCPTCPGWKKNPGAGATVQAQLWYRDPLNTSNQSTSFSDAIEFTLCQ